MKICIIHLGDLSDCISASSINKGLRDKYKSPEITWIVSNDYAAQLLKYSNFVKYVFNTSQVTGDKYDVAINLSPSIHPSDPILKSDKLFGFYFDRRSNEFYDVLYGHRKTNMNLFQVYYRLAGMAWGGQGYGLNYYPKTKIKNNRVGIAINHANLRNYTIDHLIPKSFRVIVLPYRKNVFRKMDEINICQQIVTDDVLTMHLSIYLRKMVHFLETTQQNTSPEFFGSGKIYRILDKFIK